MWAFAIVFVISLIMMFLYEKEEKKEPSKRHKTFKVLIVLFIIMLLSVFFVFRDLSVGVDSKAYYTIYTELSINRSIELIKAYDIFYSLLNILCYEIYPSYTLFLLVIAMIMFTNIVLSIVFVSKNKKISMAMFVGLGLYAQTFNMVRQMMAISFIMVGLIFLIKHKHEWLFLLFVLLASMFHITALCCVVIYVLNKVKLNRISLICISAITVIGCICFPYVLMLVDRVFGKNYYGAYSGNQFAIETWKNIVFILFCAAAIVVAMIFRKQKMKNRLELKEFDLYLLMFIILLAVKIISMFTIELLDRIVYYFIPSAIFIVPLIINSFDRKKKTVLTCASIILLLIFMIYFLYVRGSYGVVPYKFCF